MRAALDDSSIFQDKDDIRLADGCEAMSDHNTGTALHQPVEGIENDGFGYSIESGRWLVENENGSIADNGPSDPDALALAPGHRCTALADNSVVSIRQLLDETVRIRQLFGFDNFLKRGSRFAIRDVLPDRRAEEQRFLQNKSKLPTQGFQLQVAHILAVDADGSQRQLIEARDQTDDRRFARACRPDKCRSLARFDNKINIFQDQAAGCVAEAHIFKFDSALKFRCFVRPFACPDFSLRRMLLTPRLIRKLPEFSRRSPLPFFGPRVSAF